MRAPCRPSSYMPGWRWRIFRRTHPHWHAPVDCGPSPGAASAASGALPAGPAVAPVAAGPAPSAPRVIALVPSIAIAGGIATAGAASGWLIWQAGSAPACCAATVSVPITPPIVPHVTVPEPSGLLPLLAGLVALAVVRRVSR